MISSSTVEQAVAECGLVERLRHRHCLITKTTLYSMRLSA
jgi:hypothetical protein